MIEAHKIIEAPETVEDTITLDALGRHRRRIKLTTDGGIEFLLNLDRTRFLSEGDAILLTDDRSIKVIAKPEKLYAVTAKSYKHLLSLAWHIGNRHLKADIQRSRILIQVDPVIHDMLTGLGAMIKIVTEPFNPEQGAYDHHHHGDKA
jgi:urease accessory protein